MKKSIRILSALLLAAAILCGCAGCAGAGKSDVYTVGICQLTQHPALDQATKGFREALTEKLGDKVRFNEQNAQNEATNCSTICNQFVANKVDLILANATPALQSAAAATAEIPILGTSITDYATALNMTDWTGTSGRNISGTSDLAPLTEQADMLLALFPDVKKVGILYCSAEPNSKYQATVISDYLAAKNVTCTEYTFADSNDAAGVARTACEASDVVYVPTDNTVASNKEVIGQVSLSTKTPIIAGEEGICAGCGVATLSIDYYDIGYEAGLMAYDILVNGADIRTMAVKFAPKTTKKYNASFCEKLGVTPPEGYTAIG